MVGTGAQETVVTNTAFEQIRSFLEPSITVTGSNHVLISFSVPTYITSGVISVIRFIGGVLK